MSDSDIMFPALGDGCFYIGMGGKGQALNSKYEPYQCCPRPRPAAKRSNVPKLQPPKIAGRKGVDPKPTAKPVKKIAASPSPPPLKPVSKADHPIKAGVKEKSKAATKGKEGEKGKKKGFFGTGKYIWWW